MTLTNHLLTGAAISKFVPWPIAVPLAFASHFALDALPHFGFRSFEERKQHLRFWWSVLVLDHVLAILLSIWLIANGHTEQFVIGLVAASPDVIWIYRFTVQESFGRLPPHKRSRFNQFHKNIQKYERIWGGIVELIYATLLWAIIS